MMFDYKNNIEQLDADDVPQLVDKLLRQTIDIGASDLHLLPNESGLDIKWRINGVLQHVGTIPKDLSSNVVVRIKVLSGLLTYQTQIPQEGRLQVSELAIPMRVSSFPTVHGEKIVARLFDRTEAQKALLESLNLSENVITALDRGLSKNTGAVIIVGPAGSGKTTTAYACLRKILGSTGDERSVVSLEDPVEVLVPGVSQSETAPAAGFDFAKGLRSLVRQDPEVIFVGEIRDQETMQVTMQAAMTGQLVVTTFHASDCFSAIERLLDMNLPPYVLRGATNLILAQRLIRVLCDCAEDDVENQILVIDGQPIPHAKRAKGCVACQQTGYRHRRILVEALDLTIPEVAKELQGDLRQLPLGQIAQEIGLIPLRQQAITLVAEGVTSLAEVTRVFGLE